MSKIVDLTGLSRFWSNVDKKKASIDGTYPLLVSGDLAGRGESVPASFGFRASGGKSIKDGRAYIKRIKGNSVVWNQMFTLQYATTISSGVKISKNADNSLTCVGTLTDMYFNFGQFQSNIENHKYLFILDASASLDGCSFGLLNRGEQMKISGGFAYIFHTNSNISMGKYIGIKNLSVGNEINENLFVLQIDLTKAFPNDWQNINTIEEFYARVATLGIDMYAYNEGQVIHCNTESIKSVGDNAWDEQWEVGGIGSNGQPSTTGNRFRSKNFIRVIPNQTYAVTKNLTIFYYDEGENIIKYEDTVGKQFTTPTNCAYIKFYCYGTEVYDNDIMITLVHSGWKQDTDAGYQPYWQDILPLPIIRKYFPQGMKSAGTAHDEIRYNKASGKWEYSKSKTGGGRIKGVDMGSLEWEAISYNGVPTFRSFGVTNAVEHNADKLGNSITALYSQKTKFANLTEDENKVYVLNSGAHTPNTLAIRDNSYTDAATFKTAMQGVILYYESNDWEWVELDAEDQNFRDYYQVADFGTEMSQSNNVPSAAFSADIIYQFNAVDMIREHELEITELQKVIATMQTQLASLTSNNA